MKEIAFLTYAAVSVFFAFVCLGKSLERQSTRFDKVVYMISAIIWILFGIIGGYLYA